MKNIKWPQQVVLICFYIYICFYIHICVCVHIYICTYIYNSRRRDHEFVSKWGNMGGSGEGIMYEILKFFYLNLRGKWH